MPTLNFLDENGLLYFSGLIKAELNKKAPINSPNFTGTPTAPTPASQQDNSTKIATTEFVQGAISALQTIIDNGIQTITQQDMLNLTDPLPSGVYYMSDTYQIYISKNADLLCIDSFGGLQFRHWDTGESEYDIPNQFGKLIIDQTQANRVGLINIYNGDGEETVYINSATSSNAGVMSAADKNILNRIIALLGGGVDNYNLNGATSPIDIGNIYDASNTDLFYYPAYNDNSENVGIIISNVDNNNSVTSTSYQLLLSPKGVYSRRGIVNPSTNSVSWSEWKTWTEVATTSANGLMSASDKVKLDTINIVDSESDFFSINPATLSSSLWLVKNSVSPYFIYVEKTPVPGSNDVTAYKLIVGRYPVVMSASTITQNGVTTWVTDGISTNYWTKNCYFISSIEVDNSPLSMVGNSGIGYKVNIDLSSKAPLASPAFTGTPTAPTPASGTNTTQIATTAFVQSAIAAAVTGSFKFVNTLPVTGEEGYIYLVPHTHTSGTTSSNPDVKDEYIWNTSTNPAQWELIGNTDLDLTTHWAKSELEAATNAEILAQWTAAVPITPSQNSGS